MILKQTPQLEALVIASEMTTEQFTKTLISELSDRGIVPINEESYGAQIDWMYNYPVTVKEFVEILDVLSLPRQSKYLDQLSRLVLMGDGDCTECGGKMETDWNKTQSKHIFGDGINDEPEYELLYEEQYCESCGSRIKNNYQHTE